MRSSDPPLKRHQTLTKVGESMIPALASTMDECGSVTKSVDTTSSSVKPSTPLSSPSEALAGGGEIQEMCTPEGGLQMCGSRLLRQKGELRPRPALPPTASPP